MERKKNFIKDEVADELRDTSCSEELVHALRKKLDDYRDVKTRKMQGVPVLTTNPRSSYYVSNLKDLQNEYDTKLILREESEESKKKAIPLHTKVKKLQSEIKEYDSFKVEVHDFDVMALDQLKFL